jgi:hypothetical protein
MITNPGLVEAFEHEQACLATPGYLHNLSLAEALLQEARTLGVVLLNDPLDGIELDIHLARALNV